MRVQVEKELEYLVKETGRETTVLLAEAVKEGIHLLFKRYVMEAYMSLKISRDRAIELIGESELEELDVAWRAVENDIRWGLKVG